MSACARNNSARRKVLRTERNRRCMAICELLLLPQEILLNYHLSAMRQRLVPKLLCSMHPTVLAWMEPAGMPQLPSNNLATGITRFAVTLNHPTDRDILCINSVSLPFVPAQFISELLELTSLKL